MKIHYSIIIVFILFSCTPPTTNSGKEETIKVFENKISDIALKDICKEIHYIPLETRENAFIGKISKLIIRDSLIFILDKEIGKKLLVFNLNGEYKFSVGKVGKGPGEYSNPIDFSISNDLGGGIYLYDFPGKIITYDKNGKFVMETNKFSNQFSTNFINYSNHYFLYTNRMPGGHKSLVVSFNKESQQLSQYLKYKHHSTGIHSYLNPLYIYNDSLKVIDIYNPTIYFYCDEIQGFKSQYTFDFDDKYVSIPDYCDIDNFIKNYENYTFLSECLVEGEECIYYDLIDKGVYYRGVYNKKIKKNYLIKKISGNINTFNWPMFNYEGFMYSYIEPEWLFENDSINKELIETYKITRNNNPIIIKYKLRKKYD